MRIVRSMLIGLTVMSLTCISMAHAANTWVRKEPTESLKKNIQQRKEKRANEIKNKEAAIKQAEEHHNKAREKFHTAAGHDFANELSGHDRTKSRAEMDKAAGEMKGPAERLMRLHTEKAKLQKAPTNAGSHRRR